MFSDGLSQLEFDTGEAALREAYRSDFDKRLDRMRGTSRRSAIPLLTLHTESPVLDQVRDELGYHRT